MTKKTWRGGAVELEVNSAKLGGSSAPAFPKEEAGMDAEGQGNPDCWVPAIESDVEDMKEVSVLSVPTSSEGESSSSVTPVMSYKTSLESEIKVDVLNMVQNLSLQERAQASAERSSGSSTNSVPPRAGERTDVYNYSAKIHYDSQCSDLDDAEDDSDEYYMTDDSDSEDSEKSHETQKKAKWFHGFFQDLDCLIDEQLEEHDRQWHCPACRGGVGSIDWFRGLGPLASHARTMRSRRVKLHRAFGEVLEEWLRVRGKGSQRREGTYGKWKGVQDDTQNPLILWPPMVVVQNTLLELDTDEKWVGMGNMELLDYFKEYNPMKARHAYGPKGHRGMSLLLFGESPTGYHDAQRLAKHFQDARRYREDWYNPGKLLYHPGGGGNRILYGYMACNEDLEVFNRHNKGKTVIKSELRRLQEVVLEPMRLMQDQTHQVQKLQTKLEQEKEISKTLKETVSVVARNLQLRETELKVLRTRAEEQIIRNKQQQIDLAEFFRIERSQLEDEVIQKEAELQKLREEFKEAHLEQRQKLQREKSKIPKKKGLSKDEQQQQEDLMEEKIVKETALVEGSVSDAQAYEAQRVELLQKHHERRLEFQQQQHDVVTGFEMDLQAERAKLMESFHMKWRS